MEIFFNSIKFIFKDIIWSIIYFPVWWYTKGAFSILQKIGGDIKNFAHDLNLGILFKYLFKPMYGMTDIWSRIISFMVRIVQFFILSFITAIWIVLLVCLFIIWLLLPLFVLYNIIAQIGLLPYVQ
ncbi:MAG: hypothetical protein WC752_02490 [Patescibacteria group bacterium]